MDFFGMGTWEILLILVVALIVWGPGRIVEISRTLGKMVRTFKKASFDLTAQLNKELEGEEKNSPPKPEAKSGDEAKESSDAAKAEPQDEEAASQ